MVIFLMRKGFSLVRFRGSHRVMRKGELRTTVPVHENQPLKIGKLRAILRDVEMNPAEFTKLWTR